MHLESVSRRSGDDADFPFTVPAIRSLDQLRLDSTVTFFVDSGERRTPSPLPEKEEPPLH